MGGFAWVTLATNDSYSLGALVLAHSLKNVGTSHQLVVLVTPGVTNSMREKLSAVFDLVKEVNILDSKDEANLRLLKRPELGVTFTKLHCWRLTQFDKCVFLDADTLVLKNCDELFDREELSAAPDVGWPDCFNSGVFVYRPSNKTYENLVQFALERGSFDGGDQGLLNLYFSDWATKDISKHLPFIYNLCSTACYSYLPAFKQYGSDTKIIHFIGSSKPWLQYFNTETRKVQPSSDLKHLEGILQHWWNIFCSLIHPQLTREMARSTSDVTHTISSCTFETPEPTSTNIIWDPWEEYDQKQSQVPETHSPESHNPSHISVFEPQIKPAESHNTNAYHASHVHLHFSKPDHESPSSFSQESHPIIDILSPSINECSSPPPPIIESSLKSSTPPPPIIGDFSENPTQSLPPKPLSPPPSPPKSITPLPDPFVQNESEAAAVCNETKLHSAPEDDTAGLAGAFAQLTLGAPRTAEQSALDDHLRRQGWEVGNIDYMGRDSFDNIWSKICETLSGGSPAEKTTEVTPSPTTEAQVAETANEAVPPAPQPAPPVSETPQSIPLAQTETTVKEEAPQCPLLPKPAETPAAEAPQCPLKPKEEATCPIPPKEAQPLTAPATEQATVAAPPAVEQPAVPAPFVTEQALLPVAAPVVAATPPVTVAAAPATEAPAPATEAPAPVTAAPAPVTEAPTVAAPVPAPVAEVPVPEPAKEASVSAAAAPAPVAEVPASPAPVPAVPAPVPAPVIEASAPVKEVTASAPVIEASAPVKEVPASAPVIEASAPVKEVPASAPVAEAPAPAPVTEASAPAPVSEAPAPAPVKEAPIPVSVAEVPASITEAPAPAPITDAPASAPVTEAPAPVKEPSAPAPVAEPPMPKTETVAPAPVTEGPAAATVVPTTEQPPGPTPAVEQAPTEQPPPSPAEVLPPPPSESASSESKPDDQSKGASKSKSESGAAAASPTPPPRKSGGGGKKSKSKK